MSASKRNRMNGPTKQTPASSSGSHRRRTPSKMMGPPADDTQYRFDSAEADGAVPPPLPDDPTPEQIAQRSEEIRNRWSDRVKKKRHLRAPIRWSVPNVHLADIEYPNAN